jgi:ubiquinone/menaquinone biosynthesis C-methylase UbiE
MARWAWNGWKRPEREKEENSATLIKNMNIQPNDVIADIGAGSGYHAQNGRKLNDAKYMR